MNAPYMPKFIPIASRAPDGKTPAASGVRALLSDAATHYQANLRSSPEEAVHLSGLEINMDGGFNKKRRFDRFRERIMFPIRDRAGDVVGFGGRILTNPKLQKSSLAAPQAKYLNSPESAEFQKRNLLYGIYEAQEAIQADNIALVVEGYLDVISLAQAGFSPAVATLGTACTSAQITQLLALTNRVVFCFDGDAAGLRAAAHALEVALPFADDARRFEFLFLPVEHDPDSFVREQGLDAFRELLTNKALSLAEFLQNTVSEGCDLSYAEGMALCLNRAKSYWLAMPDGASRSALLSFCAVLTGLTLPEITSLWIGASAD